MRERCKLIPQRVRVESGRQTVPGALPVNSFVGWNSTLYNEFD